ncbi:hypothetical protein ABPG72_015931 [Tetrahymena utriculariae]
MKATQLLNSIIFLVFQAYCQTPLPTCKSNECISIDGKSCISPQSNECVDLYHSCNYYNSGNYIGRSLSDYACLQNKQSGTQVQCWNSNYICIDDQQTQCIDYDLETKTSSNYVGLLKNEDSTQSLYKCVQSGSTAKLDDVVKMKIPYCLDITSNIIISLIQSYTKYIGIQAVQYGCLESNQTSSIGVSYCKQGYCIFDNYCTPLSKYQPSRLDNFKCAQLNIQTSIECYKDQPFTNQSYCFDTYNNVCTQIQDFSYYSIGVLTNGNCVQQNVFYNNIFLCSDQSCLFKGNTGFSCRPFDDIYTGVDSKGNCLKRGESVAVRCKKIKFCIEQNNFTCLDLSRNYADRIGREKNTTNCLGQDDNQGQNIEICADGYCLYSISDKQNSDYCIPYGGFLQSSGPFIGVESITERCLLLDAQVNSIKLCYGLDYCILTVNNLQSCKQLYYPFSYDYINPQQYNYAAKNANENCQSINQSNSIGCAAPQLCLQAGQCISLNDKNNSNSLLIGRDTNTQICFQGESQSAQYCKLNYCLFQNQCIKLDLKYIGRQYLTSICLLIKQSTKNKIKQCLDGYCISQVKPNQYSCIKIDYKKSKNAIGYNSDMECLAVNQPVAVQCFKGMACLQEDTCQYVDISSDYKCSLSDQRCSQSLDNCSQCNFSYCLKPTNYKSCVPMEKSCQDSKGICAEPLSGQCEVCPVNTCLDINMRICISFSNMKMKENECINNLGPDVPCSYVDMNIYTDDTDLLCADEQNLCILQKEANSSFKCLRCPNNFINLGDNRCLSFQERDNSQKQDKNTIFSLNVIYTEEDMCQGKICKEQNIKKCPKGNLFYFECFNLYKYQYLNFEEKKNFNLNHSQKYFESKIFDYDFFNQYLTEINQAEILILKLKYYCFICKKVSGCDKCLYQNYLDQSSVKIKLFTCLQCQQSNYIATLLGCFQCLDGCSSCYEMGYDFQQKRFNLTAHILYENFQYDIDTRLNYKTILKVQTFCSSCLDGYYFDPIQKICIQFPCGQLCNKCIFQLNRFICIDQVIILFIKHNVFLANLFKNYKSVILYSRITFKDMKLDSISKDFSEAPSKIAVCAYLEALIGNVELTDSKFFNNFSDQENNCLVINTKQFTVNNSIFKNNDNKNIDFSNTTVRGGFIQSLTQSAIIKNSHFEGGRALKGGAIFLLFDILGNLNIQNSSFVNNLSFNQLDNENNGGAIFIDSQLCRLQAEIISTSFFQNTAFYKGGALFIQDSQYKKVISIIKSEFIDNFSQFGSVLYFEFQQKQSNIFLLTDSEISYSPINILKSISNKQIKQHVQQLNFSIQQFFLNGFFEVNLVNNKFIMSQQQYNSTITNFYGIKTYFQMSDIQQLTDQNNFYNNIFYQVSLIQMINILQVNIQYSQFNRIQSQTADSFIQIKSTFIQIYNTSFSNNSCIACIQGMVQLNSYYLNIFNCYFQQNHVYNKGILFIQQTKNQYQLPNSRILQIISDINYLMQLSFITFKNNYSQNSAGSVYIYSSSISFINCSFVKNIANLGNGGAIYYKGVDQLTNLKVQSTLFDSNQAQIGGAIYSESGQPVQNLYTKNIFKNNIAIQFSFNIFQYPHHMIAIVNGEQLSDNIITHQDGNIKVNNLIYFFQIQQCKYLKQKGGISLQFMTQENEYFMEFTVNMTLNVYLNDTQNAYLSSSQISQKSGNFKLNQLNLIGVFGLSVKLTFKSDLIKYPIYDYQTGEIISYNFRYNSFDFIVRFVQGCELGYQHLKKQKFDSCQRCNNPFYNTFPGQKCIKCPNYGFCDGGMIYLKEGYWRSDLNSTTVYQCNPEVNTCTGDIDIYEQNSKIRNPKIRYCKKGFVGPLCSDCDIYGKYWNQSYVQDGNLGCVKCNNPYYNTLPGQKCTNCPNYGKCDGGIIYLRERYWRQNLSASEILMQS